MTVQGRGVGLRNTRERLAVLYSEKHRFAVLNSHPGMRIEIGFPLERATTSPSTPKPTAAGTRVA
jgi:hypothetical protein